MLYKTAEELLIFRKKKQPEIIQAPIIIMQIQYMIVKRMKTCLQ